jgi:hypothetical protein
MPRGNLGLARKIELAQAASLAPFREANPRWRARCPSCVHDNAGRRDGQFCISHHRAADDGLRKKEPDAFVHAGSLDFVSIFVA